jgi:hypothetical protein
MGVEPGADDRLPEEETTMPATWISQTTKPSATPRTLERTAYLVGLRGEVETAVIDYFRGDAGGTQVTLAVLDKLGLERVQQIERATGKARNTIKADLGLFTILVVTDLAGADDTLTFRQASPPYKSSTRTRSSRWPQLQWVSRYTPHRLTEKGVARLLASGRSSHD